MGESDGEMPSDMPSVVKAIRAGEVHMPTSSEVLQEFPWALPCLIVALVVAFLLLAGCLVYCLRLSPAARERRELARAVKKSYAPAPGGFQLPELPALPSFFEAPAPSAPEPEPAEESPAQRALKRLRGFFS